MRAAAIADSRDKCEVDCSDADRAAAAPAQNAVISPVRPLRRPAAHESRILRELWLGASPLAHCPKLHLVREAHQNEAWDRVAAPPGSDPALEEILRGCLQQDRKLRPSAAALARQAEELLH